MAGLDSSIYSQIQAPQQVNPLAIMAQAAQLQAYQRTADKEDRALQAQNKLLGLTQSDEFRGATPEKQAQLVLGTGDIGAYGKLVESNAKASRDSREGQKFELESKLKVMDKAAQIAGTVSDQASYDRALPMMQSLGFDTSKWSPQYNPDGVKQFAMSTLDAKDKLTAQIQQEGQQIQREGQQLSRQTALETNANTVNATLTGQQLTDQRARDANAISANNKGSESVTSLRKEFQALPEVKQYTGALPAFQAIKDAATRNNPQADINLVYGVAKLYDPESVVREGEYNTVANAQSIPEQVKKWVQYVQGGGKLTAETKRQIIAEAEGRMSTFQGALEQKRTQYQDIATRTGVDPTLVLDQGYKPAITPRGAAVGQKIGAGAGKEVKRTGTTPDGRKVVQYADGTVEYR